VNGVEKRNVSAQVTFMQYFGLPNIAFNPWSPWFVTPEYPSEKRFRARVPIVSGAGGFSTG
jgi:hypothetical protein